MVCFTFFFVLLPFCFNSPFPLAVFTSRFTPIDRPGTIVLFELLTLKQETNIDQVSSHTFGWLFGLFVVAVVLCHLLWSTGLWPTRRPLSKCRKRNFKVSWHKIELNFFPKSYVLVTFSLARVFFYGEVGPLSFVMTTMRLVKN